MQDLHKQVIDDWKLAMKNKDDAKNTLSLIINEFKNRAIKDNLAADARVIDDKSAIEVLMKMGKQRRESIDSFEAANRSDLADKEKVELSVIERYLPKALSDDELKKIVQDVITKTGATSVKELGAVMGQSIKACEGRADGKRIQAVVQSLLK